MIKNITSVSLISLFLVGCTGNIREYDAEKIEFEQASKIKKSQSDPFNNPVTPEYVKVADKDDVYIEAVKIKPITGHQGIKLDVWVINAVNNSDEAKCVTINWKLQDFQLESGLPYEFLILDKESLKVGKMTQTIWSFDGAAIAIPPSGYVDSMQIKDAKLEKTTNKLTCDAVEEDIQEPKEERN